MTPFLIIKSYEYSRFVRDIHSAVYAKVTPAVNAEGVQVTRYKDISKDEARELVSKHGLVISEKNEQGTIWDTPGKSFQKRFKKKIQILD